MLEKIMEMLKQIIEFITQAKLKPELVTEGDIKTMKLGIIVGHNKTAQGAVMAAPYRLSEYVYNTEIAKLIKANAPKNMQVEIIFRDIVGLSGAYKKAIALKCDCVIELHFNAANGMAKGTETLCTPAADDIKFAGFIQKELCQVFERSGLSRGVKPLSASARGGGNVHSFPKGPNCLVEPFFGDNASEAKMAMEKKQEYAKGVVVAVEKWAKEVNLLD